MHLLLDRCKIQFYAPILRPGTSAAFSSPAETVEGFGGAEFAFEVALEGLEGEAAEVLGAAARPGLGGEGGGGGAQHALGEEPGVGREEGCAGGAVEGAVKAVRVGVEVDAGAVALRWLAISVARSFAGSRRARGTKGVCHTEWISAGGAAADVGEQAHEAGHPELKVGEGHPGAGRDGVWGLGSRV